MPLASKRLISAGILSAFTVTLLVARPASAQAPSPTETATPTATVTPTLSPTPSPTATLDHFACYESHRRPLASLKNVDVTLTDQFGVSTVTVRKANRLCAPANKNGEDPTAPAHPGHLTVYAIKQKTPRFIPVEIPVANQFGTQTLTLEKPDRLLVPTAKSLTGSPSALTDPLDHFKCYRVKGDSVDKNDVAVVTQFGPITVNVRKPLHYCSPVTKTIGANAGDPTAPRHVNQLTCYHARGTKAQLPPKIFTLNQFGPDDYQIFGERELCVPSQPPCASAGISLPSELPDTNTCTPANAADCNGWTPVPPGGTLFQQADLAATPAPARLYQFEGGNRVCTAPAANRGMTCTSDGACDAPGDPGSGTCEPETLCFYLYRVREWRCTLPAGRPCTQDADCAAGGVCTPRAECAKPLANKGNTCTKAADCDSAAGSGDGVCVGPSNGVHCYNRVSCAVCALDYPEEQKPPAVPILRPKWSDLIPATVGTIQNCADCHAPGPIAPVQDFHGVRSATVSLNYRCSEVGGPRWIGAPPSWVQQDPKRHIDAPPSCVSCHEHGFVTGAKDFCKFNVESTFKPPRGAMINRNLCFQGDCRAPRASAKPPAKTCQNPADCDDPVGTGNGRCNNGACTAPASSANPPPKRCQKDAECDDPAGMSNGLCGASQECTDFAKAMNCEPAQINNCLPCPP